VLNLAGFALRAGLRAIDWRRIGRWALVMLAALGAILGAYEFGKRSGAGAERTRARAEAIEARAKAEAIYRQKETDHAERIQEVRAEFAAANSREAESDRAVVRDLRSGSRGLRFKAARCPIAAGAVAPSGGIDETATARIAPEVAAALYSIAADGDAAIRQLTALQSWAQSAVVLCSGNSRGAAEKR
jgi:hypothetical protein